MWPLDSAIGDTTAHRASEGVADGTCSQVSAWMTNKCKKRMNQRKEYIISEISHKGGGDEAGIHILGWGVLSLGVLGHLVLFLALAWSCPISTQVVALLEPSFWTHSLQIHCTRFAGPRSSFVARPNQKTVTLQLAPSVGRVSCAMMSATVCWGKIKSPNGGYGGQSTIP